MNVKKDLMYTKDHEWIKMDGDTALMGITDYAQDSMGDIVFVELPGIGESFSEGDSIAVIRVCKGGI